MARWKSSTCFGKATARPLTTYDSEASAADAAAWCLARHGSEMEPYRCGRCGDWHLAPRDRQTPCRPCSECHGQDGRQKQTYGTRGDAERRAAIILNEKGVRLRVYDCPAGYGWHLTSQW